MSAVDNALYPSINTKIKYQQDWQKDFYHKKLSEFKVSPIGFNKIVFLGNSITQGCCAILISCQVTILSIEAYRRSY